jgi:hypothetical protein
MAFLDELQKIATQMREPGSAWAPSTIGAPRSKLPGAQTPNAPVTPGPLSSKLVSPASQYGQRQNYSQPFMSENPAATPEQGAELRSAPPPPVRAA